MGESINSLAFYNRLRILFKLRSNICGLVSYNQARRCMWVSLLSITCFLLLLSGYPTGDFGIQKVDAGSSTNQSNSPSGRTTDLDLSGETSYVSNQPQFLNYTNSTNGIHIKYPSNWNIVPLELHESRSNESVMSIKDLQLAAIFSSPTRDNVTIMRGNLGNESDNPSAVKQFINEITKNSRNTFAEYRLLDLRISSDDGTNITLDNNESNFDASARPIIFNLTYSGERSGGNDRSHLRGMDVGAIVNQTAYVISFLSTVDDYMTYLPVVLEMIYSFEVNDLSRSTGPESSISQTTISSKSPSSSNASATSREQNTVLGAEAADSSTDGSNTDAVPQSVTPQTTPNYYPPTTGTTPDSSYPTTQLYPPGYSPYPPPDYFAYSPYASYSPYTGYPPYVLDPIIPTNPIIPINPIIPPIDYSDPVIQDYNTFNDTAGMFHIVGEVENPSPYLVTSVQVVAAFYDNLNQLLAVKFANTNPSSIPSGQIAFFDLAIPPGTIPVDRVSQWTLRLVWQ
jgi:hypothetical protein